MLYFAIFALLALTAVVIALSVRFVPQGDEYTVERFGRYIRTLDPGLHFIIPISDKIGARVNMRETVLGVPPQEAITKDNATVTADVVAFYQIVDAAKASYEVTDLETAITNLAMTNVRTVIGELDLDEVLSRRDEINAKLLAQIDRATGPWGVKVTRVEIRDLLPPVDITEAMGKQLKAERERRAEILEAEGIRQAAILRAEGDKRSMVLQAEGRKEAAYLDSEAREREAEAEARATAMVSKAIHEGDINAINYFVAQKYVASLEKVAAADNSKLVMLPVEAQGLLGSIAGVGEIAKAVKSGGSDSS